MNCRDEPIKKLSNYWRSILQQFRMLDSIAFQGIIKLLVRSPHEGTICDRAFRELPRESNSLPHLSDLIACNARRKQACARLPYEAI